MSSGLTGSLGSILDKFNQSSTATATASGQNLDKVLAQLAPLAESKQTDGQSGQNKTVLYIVLAIAAAVAVIFVIPALRSKR